MRAIGICDVDDDNMFDELMKQRHKPHVIQNWMDPFRQETAFSWRNSKTMCISTVHYIVMDNICIDKAASHFFSSKQN